MTIGLWFAAPKNGQEGFIQVFTIPGSDFQLALLLNSVSKVATEGAEELLGEMERRGRVPAEAVGLTFAALARLRHLPPPRLTNALLDRCEDRCVSDS
ncbi:unnamed protein product [Effrenium voratum]|nr:unnamed protein product [Effrenium voratum]